MSLPDRNECHGCIEDFGVRHAMHPYATEDGDPIYLCNFHDAPHPRMTIGHLDPQGVMKC